MKAKIEITMDNAAFEDAASNGDELARILQHVIDEMVITRQLEAGERNSLRDINGNAVGRFEVLP